MICAWIILRVVAKSRSNYFRIQTRGCCWVYFHRVVFRGDWPGLLELVAVGKPMVGNSRQGWGLVVNFSYFWRLSIR